MITKEWSDWRNGAFWWIQSVYVRPEFRRQGVYRRLYRHVQALAKKDRRVCGFRLYVERENRRAQVTYRALGMEKTRYLVFEELKPGCASTGNSASGRTRAARCGPRAVSRPTSRAHVGRMEMRDAGLQRRRW